jgi:CRP-like cAMP-binding protein
MLLAEAHAILSGSGWLSRTPADFRTAIFAAGRLRTVAAGEVFNIAGDQQVGIWGLVDGQVAISSAMNGANTSIGLLYQPGNWGGFAPLFGLPRQANGQARTPATIHLIPYQATRQLLAVNPGWWEHVGRACFEMSLTFAAWGIDLLLRDTRARAAAVLLHQGGCRVTGEQPITIAVTQEELGEMMNLSRHPTGALLRELQTQGLIALGYRQVTLLNPEALRALANSD